MGFGNVFFLNFNFYVTLQYCIGFAMHWHESTTGVHEFPNMNPLQPPTPDLSGSSPWTSPKHPVSCIEHRLAIHFLQNSIHMFQCHSPKSSHPLPLPQSPKVCSLHLCLFCCLTYRVIINIFLNSIYMYFRKVCMKDRDGLYFFINPRYLLLKNFIFLNATKIRQGKYTVHSNASPW